MENSELTAPATSGLLDSSSAEPAAAPRYSLWQITAYFLRLGTWGFGGPVALVGYMHRDLVEQSKWISDSDYKEGLTLAQLMPGPLAAQLAIYLGYVHYGVLGATLVGIAFVMPSFLMVVALGWAYELYGGLAWMQAVFYGVGASVIAIIAVSAFRLTKKNIGADKLLWAIYLVSAALTIITGAEAVWLFLGAGVVTWLLRAPPNFRRSDSRPTGPSPTLFMSAGLPLGLLGVPVASNSTLLQVFLFFTKAGAFVFGSGLAIVPFLHSGVVQEYGWLTEQQFLDAVAVAMITPGPVVITVGFIGFLIGGFQGATIAAAATFLPCYLLTIIPAPYFKKHGKHPGIAAFVDGVTAAAIGAITGAVVILGARTVFGQSWTPDFTKVAFVIVTLLLLLKFKKLSEPLIILVAAALSLIVYPLIHP